MELALLGLLGWAAVFALFDAFDSDDDNNNDTPENGGEEPTPDPDTGEDLIQGTTGADTLSASGEETIRAGGGNDLLIGSDNAVIRGGLGNDTITATDDATAQGGFGDDVIALSENASADGGAGDDRIATDGTGLIHGGAGNDEIESTGPAGLFGDEGNDAITLHAGQADGGEGDDTITAHMMYAESGDTELTGGEGDDRFILDFAPVDGVTETTAQGNAVITDFDPSRDALQIQVDYHDRPDDVGIRTSDDGQDTLIELNYADRTDTVVLEGAPEIGPRTISYTAVDHLTDQREPLTFGTPEDDDRSVHWAIGLYGGGGNDDLFGENHAHVHGGEGDDTITVEDEALAFGEAGSDRLAAGGNAEAHGGEGDDLLFASRGGAAYGDEGDDTLVAHPYTGTEADASGTLLSGGEGTDTFILSNDAAEIHGGEAGYIADFDPASEVVAFHGPVPESVDIHPSEDGTATQLDLHFAAIEPGGEAQSLTYYFSGAPALTLDNLRFILPEDTGLPYTELAENAVSHAEASAAA